MIKFFDAGLCLEYVSPIVDQKIFVMQLDFRIDDGDIFINAVIPLNHPPTRIEQAIADVLMETNDFDHLINEIEIELADQYHLDVGHYLYTDRSNET